MTPEVERAYRHYDLAKLALLVAILILVVAMLAVLTKVAFTNQANGRLLVECTTPPELRKPPQKPRADDCYVRARAAQAEVIGEPQGPINTVTYLSVACGRVPDNNTEDEILACVIKGLEGKR